MPDPRLFLELNGNVSSDSSGGYTRFFNGNEEDFVGVESSQLQPGSVTTAEHPGQAVVPILSRLALSDYPLPPPLTINPGIGLHSLPPVHPVPPLSRIPPRWPPEPMYFLTDGSVLTISEENEQVVLASTSAKGDSYKLTTSVGVAKGQGRQNGIDVTWLYALLDIAKNGVSSIRFAFSYSAEAFLFSVFTSHGKADVVNGITVENGISVDLAPTVVENQDPELDVYGMANLLRSFSYHGKNYSRQALQVPATTLDPQLHLANEATLWPYLPDVALFSDAFVKLAGDAPQLNQSPLIALGSLYDAEPPLPVDVLTAQLTSSVVPALGPLAASLLSSDDQAVGLKAAALWLTSLLLTTSSGKAAIQAEAQAYHNLEVLHQYGPSVSPTRPPYKEPYPDTPPIDPTLPFPAKP